MRPLATRIRKWLADERGQDMVEYVLITVVISVPIVLAAVLLPPAFTSWARQVVATFAGGGP